MVKNSNIFLLAGDEDFLREEWLKSLKQKLFGHKETADTPDFNLFFAPDSDPELILSTARTRPLTADKRLIVVNEIEAVSSPSHRKAILAYLAAPSPCSVLVLVAAVSRKEFLTDKFLKEIGKSAEVVLFKRPYGAELISWISARAAARKKRIDTRTSELLGALKGNNLKILDGEIEKLSIFAAQRDAITRDDVTALVGRDAEASIYDIIDAMARKDKGRVMALSFDFGAKDLGGSAGLFCWNLRFILRAREYLSKDWAPQRIAECMGMQKFQLDRVIGQARLVDSKWLRFAIGEVAEFDLRLKTSGFCDPFLGWQMLLVRLLSGLP